MADGTGGKKRGFRTTLSHIGRTTKREHGFVNPPLLRGSTVLVPTVAERQALQAKRGERVLTYGTGGSATHWALEDAIAAIEGGTRCYIVSTGLTAAGLPEGRRPHVDAGSCLRSRAQLRLVDAEGPRYRNDILSA